MFGKGKKFFVVFALVALVAISLFVSGCATSAPQFRPQPQVSASLMAHQVGVEHPVEWERSGWNSVSYTAIPFPEILGPEMEGGGLTFSAALLTPNGQVVVGYGVFSPLATDQTKATLLAFPTAASEGKVLLLNFFANTAVGVDGHVLSDYDGAKFQNDPAYRQEFVAKYGQALSLTQIGVGEYRRVLAAYAPYNATEWEETDLSFEIAPGSTMAQVIQKYQQLGGGDPARLIEWNPEIGKLLETGGQVKYRKILLIWASYMKFQEFAQSYARPDPTRSGQLIIDNLGVVVSPNPFALVLGNGVRIVKAFVGAGMDGAAATRQFGPKTELEPNPIQAPANATVQ